MAEEGESQRVFQFQNPAAAMGSSILVLTDTTDDLYQLELALRNLLEDKDGQTVKRS